MERRKDIRNQKLKLIIADILNRKIIINRCSDYNGNKPVHKIHHEQIQALQQKLSKQVNRTLTKYIEEKEQVQK